MPNAARQSRTPRLAVWLCKGIIALHRHRLKVPSAHHTRKVAGSKPAVPMSGIRFVMSGPPRKELELAHLEAGLARGDLHRLLARLLEAVEAGRVDVCDPLVEIAVRRQ